MHVHVHMLMSPSYLYLASTELSFMVLEKIDPDPMVSKAGIQKGQLAGCMGINHVSRNSAPFLCNPLPGD